MAGNLKPNPYLAHIQPGMIKDARDCLGQCNLARERINVFEEIGFDLSDRKQLAEQMAKKAQGILAAAAMSKEEGDYANG